MLSLIKSIKSTLLKDAKVYLYSQSDSVFNKKQATYTFHNTIKTDVNGDDKGNEPLQS